MKAIRIHQFGGPEVLRLEDLPPPLPAEAEVVVEVRAASINPVDYKIRSGQYPPVAADKLPIVLGRDVSGVIAACGGKVRELKPGDAVFAMLAPEHGGYAERAVVAAADLARKPLHLDFVQAASVPLAGLTAWQGLFDHGGLRAGQSVLIHGAAGGVGHFAVQFAKARGATVLATASAADLDFVRDLGADQAIDYKAQRFEDIAHDIDVVFDLVAGETQDRSWAGLRPGGIIVSTLKKPDEAKARQHNARGTNYVAHPDGAQLAEIARLIDASKVVPTVTTVLKLADAATAQRKLEQEHLRGKIVLDVAA
jgi:NADPH:quinone reductase-like Zn-dependent oxidoreductase